MKRGISASVVSVLLAAPAFADVVMLSDDFDGENGGVTQLNYSAFANWSISAGTVDLIGRDGPHAVLDREGMYVDLDGSTRDAGVMATRSSWLFESGVEYVLEFKLAGVNVAGYADDHVTVSVGGSHLLQNILVATFQPFTIYSFTFVGNGTVGGIGFANAGGDNGGATLDDVRLRQVVPVPLPPAAWAGLGTLTLVFGMRGLAWRRSLTGADTRSRRFI